MDGTLLDENSKISNKTIKTILTAQNKGIEFVIATGRTIKSGYSFIRKKEIKYPFIELNGARLFDHKGNVQFTRQIDRDDLDFLFKIINDYKLSHKIFTQKGNFSKINIKNLRLLKDPNIQVLKILINYPKNPKLLKQIKINIKKESQNLIVTSSGSSNLEINHSNAHKGQAVADLMKLRGYKSNEVITIGDNINDLTMLNLTEHSYAVKNAHIRAKKIATYQAPSNKDKAVAQIISKVLSNSHLYFNNI